MNDLLPLKAHMSKDIRTDIIEKECEEYTLAVMIQRFDKYVCTYVYFF